MMFGDNDIPNRTYTPKQGEVVAEMIRKDGYPKAELIGSLREGKTSSKDIDILVPIRQMKMKKKFVSDMDRLFKPIHMATDLGRYQFGMITKEHGVIDIFFTDSWFTRGKPREDRNPHFDIKDRVVSYRGNVGNIVARKFFEDKLVKCQIKFQSGKKSWCLATKIFHHPTEMVLSPRQKKLIFNAIGDAGVQFLIGKRTERSKPVDETVSYLMDEAVRHAINEFSEVVYERVINEIESKINLKVT